MPLGNCGKQNEYNVAVQSKSAEKATRRSALCVSVTGRCLFNATEEGTIKILRTFCPEGWNFHKCFVLAKTCFQRGSWEFCH